MQTAELLNLAVQEHRAGHLEKAESLYRQVLERDADQPDALHLLGVLAGESRQLETALRLIERAVAINTTNPHYQFNLGNVLRELGRMEDSLAAYREATRLDPGFGPAYATAAAALQSLDRFAEAVHAYQQAIALQPDDVEIRCNLAVALKDLGRLNDAITELYRCREIRPDFARGQLVLAGYLLESGDASAALAACDRCLQLNPRDVQALAFKSVALGALGKGEALRLLCDFERLVQQVRPHAPNGFADLDQFNAALVQHVRSHPSLIKQPTSGATRFGSHTEELLVEPRGPMASFEAIVNDAVAKYLASLPTDPGHPYLARRPAAWRLTVWGVILGAQGYQDPHMHASGWVSGVYYARVPREVATSVQAKAGWIEFGRPPSEFPAQGAFELLTIEPREGLLLLFPSYVYHRTIPFMSDAERISIAFDVLPEF